MVWLMEAFDSSIFPRQRASSRSRHHPKGRPNHGSGSEPVKRSVSPHQITHQPPTYEASGWDRIVLWRRKLGQIDGDVDDHVLLATHVAGLAHPTQDLVRRDAVAIGGALRVQQERVVDPEPALHDRRPIGHRQPVIIGLTISSAAASTPSTSTPVGTSRLSKTAARLSVGEFPAPAPSAPNSRAALETVGFLILSHRIGPDAHGDGLWRCRR